MGDYAALLLVVSVVMLACSLIKHWKLVNFPRWAIFLRLTLILGWRSDRRGYSEQPQHLDITGNTSMSGKIAPLNIDAKPQPDAIARPCSGEA